MTDENFTLWIGMTLAEMDKQFNPGRREAHERRMAEARAWHDQELERVRARGVELKKQLGRHILDHMPMPKRSS